MNAPEGEPLDEESLSFADAVLEGRATPEESARFEAMLLEDERLMDYCAERFITEGEISEAVNPLRIEWTEQRRLVIERGPPARPAGPSGRELEMSPPPREGRRRYLWLALGLGLGVAAGAVAIGIWWSAQPEGGAAPPALRLFNPDFEAQSFADSTATYFETIEDWDDYFPCDHSELVALSRWSRGKFRAPSGTNVVHFKGDRGAWITQRLRLGDGTPLLARKGMKVRVEGAVFLESDDPAKAAEARYHVSLRHVARPHTDMVQYTAAYAEMGVDPGAWRRFSALLETPVDSLVLPVAHKAPGSTAEADLDLEGLPLTLSIDAFYIPTLYLDDISIEVLDPGTAAGE